MANFKTHRNVGIIGSTAATFGIISLIQNTNLIQSEPISISLIISMIIIGTIGSFAPDIDLDHSKPSKILSSFFFLIFIGINSLWVTQLIPFLDFDIVQENVDLSIFIISFLFAPIFAGLLLSYLHSKMDHRGLVHSIPFGLVLSIGVFLMSENSFGTFNSYMISIMFFIGFIIHLVLDEIYSIDFSNRRIKKSFGTALKLIQKDNIMGTIICYSIIISFIFLRLF